MLCLGVGKLANSTSNPSDFCLCHQGLLWSKHILWKAGTDARVSLALKVDIAAFLKISQDKVQGVWESLFGVGGFSVCPDPSPAAPPA